MKILAADMGGTNSRFGLFSWEDGVLCLLDSRSVSPEGTDGFPALLDEVASWWRSRGVFDAGALSFAAAGPLRDFSVRMTNTSMVVDGTVMRSRFPGARCLLMNDFEAQAWACLSPAMEASACVLPGRGGNGGALFHPDRGDGRPVLAAGAGTGLGAALLVPGVPRFAGVSRPFVLSSEAGHAVFPFDARRGDEAPLMARLAGACGAAPSCEQVLSGRGLAAIHAILSGEKSAPAVFTADPQFAESGTCAMYARLFGRFCRNAVLSVLPQALVIAGGVAGRTPALVRHPAFAEEFLAPSSVGGEICASVPVWLDAHPLSGLWGAAQAAVSAL